MAVGIPLVAVTVADERVGIAAALALRARVHARAAARCVAYFARRGARHEALSQLVGALFLALPPSRSPRRTGDEEEFDPAHEWELKTWVDLPFGTGHQQGGRLPDARHVVTSSLGIVLMRVKTGKGPDKQQALGEMVYEIAQVQVAEQGLPTKAIGRWFPYVASLMIFIWVINMLGFIPLPLSDEKVEIGGVELPTLAIFAATSTLSVTLALAFMTWVFTHIEGIRANGAASTSRAGSPTCPKAMLPLIIPLEILGQFMRLISLSVRLYANMLAGHMLILTFIGLIFLTPLGGVPVLRRDGDRLLPLRGRDRRLDPGLHLRRPVRHLHRLGHRAGALRRSPHACSSLLAETTGTSRTPARRSRSRSASASARSAPASGSATSRVDDPGGSPSARAPR